MSFWAGSYVQGSKTYIIISGRKTKMAKVTLSWPASPAAEQVTGYSVSMDGAVVGTPTAPTYVVDPVTPGVHSFAVAPVNIWGSGPASDAKATPGQASKIPNLTISITVP
jgi:hypothetical protein